MTSDKCVGLYVVCTAPALQSAGRVARDCRCDDVERRDEDAGGAQLPAVRGGGGSEGRHHGPPHRGRSRQRRDQGTHRQQRHQTGQWRFHAGDGGTGLQNQNTPSPFPTPSTPSASRSSAPLALRSPRLRRLELHAFGVWDLTLATCPLKLFATVLPATRQCDISAFIPKQSTVMTMTRELCLCRTDVERLWTSCWEVHTDRRSWCCSARCVNTTRGSPTECAKSLDDLMTSSMKSTRQSPRVRLCYYY